MVASRASFADNAPQVGADGRDGVRGGSKTRELRMKPVTARLTEEHLLGEEGLAPEGNESHAVEMGGMQGPESQDFALLPSA